MIKHSLFQRSESARASLVVGYWKLEAVGVTASYRDGLIRATMPADLFSDDVAISPSTSPPQIESTPARQGIARSNIGSASP